MKMIFFILGQIFHKNDTADKAISVGSGIVASVATYFKTAMEIFVLKCITAAVFALIGGIMGFFGKKIAEHIFSKIKNRVKK
jgi:hypothetical protein